MQDGLNINFTIIKLNSKTNNLYVEGFDDFVTIEMINMLCNE